MINRAGLRHPDKYLSKFLRNGSAAQENKCAEKTDAREYISCSNGISTKIH